MVRSLRRGLNNCDTVEELQNRLRALPDDLIRFFQYMLDSIDKEYHAQSARLFQLCLASATARSVMALSFFHEDSVEFALCMSIRSWSRDKIDEWNNRSAIRIRARCTDLIEIKSESPSSSLLKVDFIHRTARDFLLERDVQNLLHARSTYTSTLDEYFCASFLAQIKLYSQNHLPRSFFVEAMDELLKHAKQAQKYCGKSCASILDQLNTTLLAKIGDNLITTVMSRWLRSSPDLRIDRTLVLQIATDQYLDKYIKQKIKEDLTGSFRQDCLRLLMTMLIGGNGRAWHVFPPSQLRESQRAQKANKKLLRFLLENGARLHLSSVGQMADKPQPDSLWEMSLRCLSCSNSLSKAYVIDMVKLFLEHGANPMTRIKTPGHIPRFNGEPSSLGLLDVVEQLCGKGARTEIEIFLRDLVITIAD